MPKKKHAPRKPPSPQRRRPVTAGRVPTYAEWVRQVRGDGPAVLSPSILAMFLGEALEAVAERSGHLPRHSLTDADVEVVLAWLLEEDDDDPLRRAGVLAGLATWVDYLVETRQWEHDAPDAQTVAARLKSLALTGLPRDPGAAAERAPVSRQVVDLDREALGRFHEQFVQWLAEQPEAPDLGDLGNASPAEIVDLALEEMLDRDDAVSGSSWPAAVLSTVLQEFPAAVAARQGLGPSGVDALRGGLTRVVLKYLEFLVDGECWDGSADELAGNFALLRSHLEGAGPSNPGSA